MSETRQSETKPKVSLRDIAKDKTLALMLALGFSSGLPFLLVVSSQAARLTDAKVPIETIGLISWVGFFYSLKFFWAPVIDGFDIPLLSRLLGRRRSWLLAAQVCVACGLASLAFVDPSRGIGPLIACSSFTAFAASTQDIVVDGWRIDSATVERQGIMAAIYNLGYRLGITCAGAGGFYIADLSGWSTAYFVMAGFMVIGIAACLIAPRVPEKIRDAPKSFASRFTEPLADLARRFGPMLGIILLLVALYRLPDFLTGVMANPLYIKLGFSKSDIATTVKLYGLWIGIAGAFAGGYSIARIGLMPSLLIGGISASASHLCLALLAANGKSIALLTLSVSAESFAGNFAGAALIAYMSSLTSPTMAASQYALLSSLYAILGKFVGGFSGYAVKAVGFPTFFASASTIGIPVALLCLVVWARQRSDARASKTADRGIAPA